MVFRLSGGGVGFGLVGAAIFSVALSLSFPVVLQVRSPKVIILDRLGKCLMKQVAHTVSMLCRSAARCYVRTKGPAS